MVDKPDLNKAIDVALEEYKTLRAEIHQNRQNGINVVVFGGALVATLLGLGVTSLSFIPTTTKTTAITGKSSTQTRTKTTTKTEKSLSKKPKTTEQENKQTTETIKPFGQETVTTTIQPINEDKGIKEFQDIPIYRRLPSGIILGIFVPLSCAFIMLLWISSERGNLFIGRYIAINIEAKINYLYFNDLPPSSKPLTWENYMQTLKHGLLESWSVYILFGVIALGSSGGAVIILGISTWYLLLLPLILAIYIFCQIVKMEKMRNEEGSFRRIYYPEIGSKKSQEIKPQLIIWKSYFPYKTELKNPFYFQNGQTATNILELYSFCVDPNNSEECIKHLKSENFENWLSYIGETKLADTTKNLKLKNIIKYGILLRTVITVIVKRKRLC